MNNFVYAVTLIIPLTDLHAIPIVHQFFSSEKQAKQYNKAHKCKGIKKINPNHLALEIMFPECLGMIPLVLAQSVSTPKDAQKAIEAFSSIYPNWHITAKPFCETALYRSSQAVRTGGNHA